MARAAGDAVIGVGAALIKTCLLSWVLQAGLKLLTALISPDAELSVAVWLCQPSNVYDTVLDTGAGKTPVIDVFSPHPYCKLELVIV